MLKMPDLPAIFAETVIDLSSDLYPRWKTATPASDLPALGGTGWELIRKIKTENSQNVEAAPPQSP